MEYLSFTIDSALLRELGEKLVETVHLALVELVKNSYDADASEVKIRFTEDAEGNEEIHIIDNGIGMNFEAVEKYWMRIATTNKTTNNLSPLYGRPRTGAKGIGRFCCRRLGSKLKLITIGSDDGKTKEGKSIFQKTEVGFPWNEFIPGTSVTEIRCPGTQTTLQNVHTGTTLIISCTQEAEWNLRGFNWLKRQLAVLAANSGALREGYEEDPGFNIILESPDFEEEVKDIREELINGGWATLTAYINKKHQAVCKLDALGIGKKTITSSKTFPHLQDITLKIGIMVDRRGQMRDTSIISKTTLQEILPEWGGVQVRYHGFRVYPYGDDDWLDIDYDRGLRRGTPKDELSSFAQNLKGVDASRALLNMLSMRSHVGNVNIGGEAIGFEMKSSREGFLSSPSVDELKRFARFAIDWATIYRDYYIRTKANEEAEIARRVLEDVINKPIKTSNIVQSAVQYIQKEVKNLATSLPTAERQKLEKSVEQATDAILKHEASNKEELSHLRLIASTSTLLLIFSHEVKSLLGMLETIKNSLVNIEAFVAPPERESVGRICDNLTDLKERFQDLLSMTSLVGIDSRDAQPGQIALRERVENTEKIFQLILSTYEIKIDYEQIPNNIVIKSILEAELYAILLNVLSNSIKSVIAAGGSKKIQLTAHRENKKTVIRVKDTGLGIDPSHYDEVFIPFVADPDARLYGNLDQMLNPADKYIVGTGSGLGLSIVREIVQVRNGSITFQQPENGWKTELEIILP